MSNNYNKELLVYVNKLNEIYGDTYNYDKVNLDSNDVILTCKIHGDFISDKEYHLLGNGCPECLREKQKRRLYKYYKIRN